MRFLVCLGVMTGLSACGALSGSGKSTVCTSGGTCKMYITNAIYEGNLGGITGADNICNNDLNRPIDSSTYRALIVDGVNRTACETSNCGGGVKENQNWVIHPNTKYVDVNGNTIVISNQSGVWLNGELRSYINSDHSSNKGTTLFTGMAFDFTTSTNNCSQWSGTSGSAESASTLSEQIPQNITALCSSLSNALICVEQ